MFYCSGPTFCKVGGRSAANKKGSRRFRFGSEIRLGGGGGVVTYWDQIA